MYCTKCGFKYQEGAIFCSSCGTKIEPQQLDFNLQEIYSEHQAIASLKLGSVVKFGHYPQTMKMGSNPASSPIDWFILHVNTDTMEFLLISKHILDCRTYHGIKCPVTWYDSEIRWWLNTEFFNRAFNAEEKQKIIPTLCTGNGVGSGNDLPQTTDHVFLLSSYEAQFFGGDANRIARGTEYAKEITNLFTYGWDNKARWWLRNRGKGGAVCVAYVQDSGNIYDHGHDVDEKHYGIRPAIRVCLKEG